MSTKGSFCFHFLLQLPPRESWKSATSANYVKEWPEKPKLPAASPALSGFIGIARDWQACQIQNNFVAKSVTRDRKIFDLQFFQQYNSQFNKWLSNLNE